MKVSKTTITLLAGFILLAMPSKSTLGSTDKLVSNTCTGIIKDAMEPYLARGEFVGGISILFDNGKQEVTFLGNADDRNQRPITLDSMFRQCSQSKGVCGVAMAKLLEEGRVHLDDPVSKYLPVFSGRRGYLLTRTNGIDGAVTIVTNAITLRMCMTHMAGFKFELENYAAMGGWNHRMPLQSVAATVLGQPLRFQPGTQTGYSNLGYDVAAAVIEKVTGMRYEEYLQRTVFGPLGMKDTTFYPTDEQLQRKIELFVQPDAGGRARCVEASDEMQSPFNGDRVFPSAGAGLWTTARDQYRFYKMLMNLGVGDNGVRILKSETVKNYLARSVRPRWIHKGGDGLSLGFAARLDPDENSWFGHGGAYGTECFVNPTKRYLKLWVVQATDITSDWAKVRRAAEYRFFDGNVGKSDDSYTNRLK